MLAKLGFDLMDRKRNILIREMMGLIDRAGSIQNKINSTFSKYRIRISAQFSIPSLEVSRIM